MEKENNLIQFLMVPFTGLGLWGGMRGNNWLKNRITIFKEYVLPSILNQSNQNFYLLISWRPEEKENPIVKEFADYMNHFRDLKTIFTYEGILFWDDKYSNGEAEKRLRNSLEKTLPQLNIDKDIDWVLLTIQPSDDCYLYNMVEKTQEFFQQNPKAQAVGYKRGYIIRMDTKEISNYDPTTLPPFFTIKFPRDIFLDPKKHYEYISIKHNIEI